MKKNSKGGIKRNEGDSEADYRDSQSVESVEREGNSRSIWEEALEGDYSAFDAQDG